ncbi:MAG: VCBS repeat-containing protein [Planctomycetes bacterium]|nr:VCBS repeat-containing protein [Planctomycetota bacterium]
MPAKPIHRLLRIVCLLTAGASAAFAADASRQTLQRVTYQSPGATSYLGVGLWAWPMPIDWDEDGDLDLVVSCPDVPFRGTYLFENPGGDRKMPVFKAPVLVGPGISNITLSTATPEPRILTPGFELVDFRKERLEKSVRIHATSNVHPNRVRANQWRYADYDGDGAMDLIVGVGDWTDYGWDNAFDRSGTWTNGPLHGFVYWLRNRGTDDEPDYAEPVKIEAGGQPVDVFGMPSPNLADFDGDGDLDLLCGEFLDGFSYFENVGSRTQPRYAAARRLEHAGSPIRMDLQMITPTAIDWDADGDIDLIVGDEDGRVAFVEHTGEVVAGLPQFLPPVYFRQEADNLKFGALATPCSYDWDGDGDEDLICGNTAGYVGFIENIRPGDPPQWAEPVLLQAGGTTLRIQAGPNGSIQGPCEAKWGYTTLSVADWDHDGLADLVVNSIWGKVVWYRNVGSRRRPELAEAEPVEVAWPADAPPPRPAWNWWEPKGNELCTQWRTTPVVIDLDADGLNDLVMLDHEGYLTWFRRQRRGDQLLLLPGQRIFHDSHGQPLRLNAGVAGRSGRRKLCFADWDGDGKLDLLVNGVNVDFFRNVSTTDRPWVFENEGPVDPTRLAGHTTSPTVVDWNRDGRPDLLIGAEDGHFYYRPNNWEPPRRWETPELIVETKHVSDGVLEDGATAFSNRAYQWFDVPRELTGWRITRTFGGEQARVAVTAKQDTTLLVATSRDNKALEDSGWKPADGWSFGYTDAGRTRMQVFRRSIAQGERIVIPQDTWTGSLLLIPREP